jgi:hypothetical protein
VLVSLFKIRPPRLLIASPFSPLGLTEDYHYAWYYLLIHPETRVDKELKRGKGKEPHSFLLFLFASPSFPPLLSPLILQRLLIPLVEIYRGLSLIGASS